MKFRKFENVGHSLSLRALTHELDWVAVNPLVPHCVMEDCAHEVPNLRSRAFCPLDAVQPFFNCDRLDLIKPVISPARKNPALQIAFVRGSRRKRLASLILTNQLLEPVVSDQFGNRARPAFRLRGLLVGVNAQRLSCFEGRCFRWKS